MIPFTEDELLRLITKWLSLEHAKGLRFRESQIEPEGTTEADLGSKYTEFRISWRVVISLGDACAPKLRSFLALRVVSPPYGFFGPCRLTMLMANVVVTRLMDASGEL